MNTLYLANLRYILYYTNFSRSMDGSVIKFREVSQQNNTFLIPEKGVLSNRHQDISRLPILTQGT